MPNIHVRRIGHRNEFEVKVNDQTGETSHHVTLSSERFRKLVTGKHTPEQCIEAAFRFLLDREPKEAILKRFNLGIIATYFPEFEKELSSYLPSAT